MNRYRKTLVIPVALLVVAFAPTALGRPHGGGKGSGSGYAVTLSPGPYAFGDSMYVTTNVPVTMSPYIWMRCYQNGVLVGSSDHAAFPTGWYYGWPFSLGPTMAWNGGAADCTFSVVHIDRRKVVTDAVATIHVTG